MKKFTSACKWTKKSVSENLVVLVSILHCLESIWNIVISNKNCNTFFSWVHWHCIYKCINMHFSLGSMDLKFGTQGYLGSLSMNPSSTFINRNGGSNMADQNAKSYFIGIKFGTWRSLGSLNMNPSSTFINSEWRSQYGRPKCKKLFD